METFINRDDLKALPNHIFVFGDNQVREGLGGAAHLRYEPNTYGFITKVLPDNNDNSFYRVHEYQEIFKMELDKLINEITSNPNKIYMISKLGAGLANKYMIWENIICDGLEVLKQYNNVKFLYEEEDK